MFLIYSINLVKLKIFDGHKHYNDRYLWTEGIQVRIYSPRGGPRPMAAWATARGADPKHF
jgi:hypothetical protein